MEKFSTCLFLTFDLYEGGMIKNNFFQEHLLFIAAQRDHGGRVVTLSPPTSEAGVRSSAWPQVGKLVVACRWSAVYSTEP